VLRRAAQCREKKKRFKKTLKTLDALQERCMLSWAPRSWARQVLLPPTSRADKLLPRALLAVSAVRRAVSDLCDSDKLSLAARAVCPCWM